MVNIIKFDSMPQEDCAICLRRLDEDVIGHDQHRFHRFCLIDAVERQSKCPLCRKEVDKTKVLGMLTLKERIFRDPNAKVNLASIAGGVVLGLAPIAAIMSKYTIKEVISILPTAFMIVSVGTVASLGIMVIAQERQTA